MMKEIRDIPELLGFAVPTTVDEFEEILALLPDDMRLAAMRDLRDNKNIHISINRATQEIAIARPCANGTWTWSASPMVQPHHPRIRLRSEGETVNAQPTDPRRPHRPHPEEAGFRAQ
jgi:acyl dehydratase